MARKHEYGVLGQLLVLVSIGVLVYFTFQHEFGTPVWVLFGITVLLLWVCFAMPTRCDYQTRRGTRCERMVHGILRGCRQHARLKRDAVFAAFGTSNPGRRLRRTWQSEEGPRPPVAVRSSAREPAPGEPAPSGKARFDVAMLSLTVVSTTASVVALFV